MSTDTSATDEPRSLAAIAACIADEIERRTVVSALGTVIRTAEVAHLAIFPKGDGYECLVIFRNVERPT
jgi:hypothetical protein